MTNHGRDNIKNALRDLACAAGCYMFLWKHKAVYLFVSGIEHREWFNPGSTWYGNGRRVRNLAKLTVALNKFGRGHMFGPGTACR